MGVSQFPVSSGRLVTKQNTSSDLDLTGLSAALTNSMSSWAQVTASTGAEYILTRVSYSETTNGGLTNGQKLTFEVGIGGAGSEVTVVSRTIPLRRYAASASAGDFEVPVTVPVRIAAGTRVALRAQVSASTSNGTFYLTVVPWASLDGN